MLLSEWSCSGFRTGVCSSLDPSFSSAVSSISSSENGSPESLYPFHLDYDGFFRDLQWFLISIIIITGNL